MPKILNSAFAALLLSMQQQLAIASEGAQKAASPSGEGLNSPGAEKYNQAHASDETGDRIREWVRAPLADLKAQLDQALQMEVLIDPPAAEMPPPDPAPSAPPPPSEPAAPPPPAETPTSPGMPPVEG